MIFILSFSLKSLVLWFGRLLALSFGPGRHVVLFESDRDLEVVSDERDVFPEKFP